MAKKVNLNEIKDLKPFIDYETKEPEIVLITEVEEKGEDLVRFTVENRDGKIQFLKFYFTSAGLPFYKKFVEDAGFSFEKAENPLYLAGEKIAIETVFTNEDKKFTRIFKVSPAI